AAVGPVLPVAIPAVMRVEEPGLDGVLVADESDVVGQVEVAAGIATPKGAAPSGVGREAQLRQAAVGTRDARNLQFFVEFVRGIGREHSPDAGFLLIAPTERVDDARAESSIQADA